MNSKLSIKYKNLTNENNKFNNIINDMRNDAEKLELHNYNIIKNLENNINELIKKDKQNVNKLDLKFNKINNE